MPSSRGVAAASGRHRLELPASRGSANQKLPTARHVSRRKGLDRGDLPEVVPRKHLILASRIRALAIGTCFIVLLAIMFANSKRRRHRFAHTSRRIIAIPRPSFNFDALRKAAAMMPSPSKPSSRNNHELSQPTLSDHTTSNTDAASNAVASSSAITAATVEVPVPASPEQIESFSHPNMANGTRPMCRVNNACIINNNGSGVLSLPSWMTREDSVLRKCGVNPRKYHTSIGALAKSSSHIRHIDADLVQQIRLSTFNEPPTAMTEHFLNSVLRAAFQLEVFESTTSVSMGTDHHCIANHTASFCDGAVVDAMPTADLRPAIIVPKKLVTMNNSWEAHSLELVKSAYGRGDLLEITTADLMTPPTDEETPSKDALNNTAVCFRSIIFTNANFNELPARAFEAPSVRLFASNGIDRAPRPPHGPEQEEQCKVSITIMKKSGHRALRNVDALQEQIEEIAKAALPSVTVTVNVLSPEKDSPFSNQVASMAETDILVGGTSHSLSNMAFMRAGATVFEVFPFGWQPSTFAYLANVMGIKYFSIGSKPQTAEFNECIEHEVLQLRKQNRLQEGEDSPEWLASLESRWSQAVAEYTLSGKSSLLLNSDRTGVSNFHTRSCARQQSLDFNVEDIAKEILLQVRNVCKQD
jgi:Glycosyltransferase 61